MHASMGQIVCRIPTHVLTSEPVQPWLHASLQVPKGKARCVQHIRQRACHTSTVSVATTKHHTCLLHWNMDEEEERRAAAHTMCCPLKTLHSPPMLQKSCSSKPAATAATVSAASAAAAAGAAPPDAAAGMRPAGRAWLPTWIMPRRKVPVVSTTLRQDKRSPARANCQDLFQLSDKSLEPSTWVCI